MRFELLDLKVTCLDLENRLNLENPLLRRNCFGYERLPNVDRENQEQHDLPERWEKILLVRTLHRERSVHEESF